MNIMKNNKLLRASLFGAVFTVLILAAFAAFIGTIYVVAYFLSFIFGQIIATVVIFIIVLWIWLSYESYKTFEEEDHKEDSHDEEA